MSRSDGPRVEVETLTEAGNMTVYFDASKTTSLQVVANQDATGTLAATIALTTSNHPYASRGDATSLYKAVPAVWSSESAPSLTAITTGAQDNMYHAGNFGAKWGKLVVTYTSGAGRVEILISGRD